MKDALFEPNQEALAAAESWGQYLESELAERDKRIAELQAELIERAYEESPPGETAGQLANRISAKKVDDPRLVEVLENSRNDRALKNKFGYIFAGFAALFTAASYGIVIAKGVWNLGISDVAITALVIETPLQLIGLLYIMARNLFPQKSQFIETRRSSVLPVSLRKVTNKRRARNTNDEKTHEDRSSALP